jgi:hypothetical protein
VSALVAAIDIFSCWLFGKQGVDGRDKPGHELREEKWLR